jgi:hypothetical protein
LMPIEWYRGAEQPAIANVMANRRLAAIRGAGQAAGGVLGLYKQQQDKEDLLNAQLSQAGATMPDAGPVEAQTTATTAGAESKEEAGFGLSPGSGAEAQTAPGTAGVTPPDAQYEPQVGQAEQQGGSRGSTLGKYAQRFFAPLGILAPFGMGGDPLIQERERRLGAKMGQIGREEMKTKRAQALGRILLHSADPGKVISQTSPGMFPGIGPGTLPGAAVKESNTNLDTLRLRGMQGDKAAAAAVAQADRAKIAAAGAGAGVANQMKSPPGILPRDEGNQAVALWMLNHPGEAPNGPEAVAEIVEIRQKLREHPDAIGQLLKTLVGGGVTEGGKGGEHHPESAQPKTATPQTFRNPAASSIPVD